MTRTATPRLVLALTVSAVGAIVAITAGRVDAALLVAPWTALLLLGLSGAREQTVEGSVSADSERVVAGDVITVTATVLGATGWARVHSSPDPGFFDAAQAREDLGSGPVGDVVVKSGTEISFELTTSAWGTHDVGRVNLQVNEPYGLLRWTGSLASPTRIQVHPRPAQLDELLTPWLVRRLAGAHESRAVGQGIEFAELRQFTAGDSLRDINWRASARSNELWVSQRHPDQSTEVVLLVDTFIESGHEIRTVLGLAIEAATALAETHLAATDRVGLIELGGIVRWVSPGTGRLQLQRLVNALLATRLYESSAERTLDAVPYPALPPRSFVIALSPLLDARFVRTLLVLRAAGHDVSVIECPPLLAGQLDLLDGTTASKLALRIWQAERDLTRDELAAQGVAIGRWAPGDPVEQVVGELVRRRRTTRAALRQ